MASRKPLLLFLRVFATSLLLFVTAIGGAFVITYVAPLLLNRAFPANTDKDAFPRMTLVTVDVETSLSPLGCLIGFGVVFLLTLGLFTLPKRGRGIVVVTLCALILGFWIVTGLVTRQALTAPSPLPLDDESVSARLPRRIGFV
jgi:hypothetical protein